MRFLAVAVIATAGISGCRKSVNNPAEPTPGTTGDASHSDRSETAAPVVPIVRNDPNPASDQGKTTVDIATKPSSKRTRVSSAGTDRAPSTNGAALHESADSTSSDAGVVPPEKEKEDLRGNERNGSSVTGRTYKRPVVGRASVQRSPIARQRPITPPTGGLRGPLNSRPQPNSTGIRRTKTTPHDRTSSFVTLPIETRQSQLPNSSHDDSDEESSVRLQVTPITDDSDEATVRWNQRNDFLNEDDDSMSVDSLATEDSLDSSADVVVENGDEQVMSEGPQPEVREAQGTEEFAANSEGMETVNQEPTERQMDLEEEEWDREFALESLMIPTQVGETKRAEERRARPILSRTNAVEEFAEFSEDVETLRGPLTGQDELPQVATVLEDSDLDGASDGSGDSSVMKYARLGVPDRGLSFFDVVVEQPMAGEEDDEHGEILTEQRDETREEVGLAEEAGRPVEEASERLWIRTEAIKAFLAELGSLQLEEVRSPKQRNVGTSKDSAERKRNNAVEEPLLVWNDVSGHHTRSTELTRFKSLFPKETARTDLLRNAFGESDRGFGIESGTLPTLVKEAHDDDMRSIWSKSAESTGVFPNRSEDGLEGDIADIVTERLRRAKERMNRFNEEPYGLGKTESIPLTNEELDAFFGTEEDNSPFSNEEDHEEPPADWINLLGPLDVESTKQAEQHEKTPRDDEDDIGATRYSYEDDLLSQLSDLTDGNAVG